MSIRSVVAVRKTSGPREAAQLGVTLLAVALAYIALAKLGLMLASVHPSATPIWPPTGFAIAALLLWGNRMWPALFVGAFIANALTAGTLVTSTAIATGNTLEALIITGLARRWSGGVKSFDTPGGVVVFALIAATTGTVLSSIVGVVALCAAGVAPWENFADIWATWWLGNLAGGLVVAPLVVLWVRPAEKHGWAESLVVYAVTVAVGLVAFSPVLGPSSYRMPLSFLAIVPLVWAGLRRGQRETATVAFVLSCFALWGVLMGDGPFTAATVNDSTLRLIAFMIGTTVPSLALAADAAERRRVETMLRGQQQGLRAMFNQALVGIVETDPMGRIASVNERFCEIIQRPSDQIIGRRMQELTDPDDFTRDDVQFREIATKGGGFVLDKRYVRPDGTRVWVRNNVAAITGPDGKVTRLLTVSEDVTDRRRAREELERLVRERTAALADSEGRFRLIVESVADYALYMIDAEGRVTAWNAGAERVMGHAESQILGRHYRLFFTDEDRARGEPERALAEAAAKGRFESEGWRVRKDGTRFWASALLQPIRDSDGKLLGFAKITRDITERRESTEALEQAREQLFQAQKLEAVGQLTGGVAHDFNNILAVILSGVALIERQVGENPRLRHLLTEIRQAARRGEHVTKQLLTFSRRQALKPEVVDVAKRLNDMFDLLDRLLGDSIRVEMRVDRDVRPVEVDASQLELALLNVCLNARDAMPRGGTLIVSARNAGDMVAISVADTGIGMPEEVRSRVFEPFFTTKEIGKGSGLGLSQAYGFAQQSGGRIEIESAPGKGTTVTLHLPAARPVAAPAEEPQRARSDVRASGTILVIEDDVSLAAVTAALIEDSGYTVKLAHSAAAAIEELEGKNAGRIDAVFSDIVMPGGMNGFELARKIRSQYPHIPILLTTGYSGAASPSQVAGVEVMAKPYDPDKVVAVLGELIAQAKRTAPAT
jgi:PAS domain S-box-containing protein